MRPARQQMLTILAAFSFFESRFAEEAVDRKGAVDYLVAGLAAQNDDVTVRLPEARRPG